MGNDQSLAEKAVLLAQTAVANWLSKNCEWIRSASPSKSTVFQLVGGSLVEGLMTRGSDLDFCMMIDGETQGRDLSRLGPSFKRSMARLDDQLRQLRLGGLCRISRRIHSPDEFLELHRCAESEAAKMRSGIRLNYILTCRLLDIGPVNEKLGLRLATRAELLSLKNRLYQCYHETLGHFYIPMLPYLLERPSSYTPRRVMEQVQLGVNNILLVAGAMEEIATALEGKISKVVDFCEGELATAKRAAIKDELTAGIDLICSIKQQASIDENLRQKSFHQLLSEGYIQKREWEQMRQLTGYCLKLFSALPYMTGI